MQVFLTSSSTLREQVAKAFRRLQAPALGVPKAARLAALAAQDYPTLADMPSEAFPLFLTPRCAI